MINADTEKLLIRWCDECLNDLTYQSLTENKVFFIENVMKELRDHSSRYEIPDASFLHTSDNEKAIKNIIKNIMCNFFPSHDTWLLKNNYIAELKCQYEDLSKKRQYTQFFDLLVEKNYNYKSLSFLIKVRKSFDNAATININSIRDCIQQQSNYVAMDAFFVDILETWENEIKLSQPKIILDNECSIILAKIYLNTHADRYRSEFNGNNLTLHAIHFFNSLDRKKGTFSPRASEFTGGFDSDDENSNSNSFNITAHGLGSGVYCVGDLTKEIIDSALQKEQSHYKIIELKNYLRLYDEVDGNSANESDYMTEISKYLQSAADQLKEYRLEPASQKKNRTEVVFAFFKEKDNNTYINVAAQILSEFKSINKREDELLDILLISMVEWFNSATKANLFVQMPINFLIRRLGFCAMISKLNDSFNRGLISFDVAAVDHIQSKLSRQSSFIGNRSRGSSSASPTFMNRTRCSSFNSPTTDSSFGSSITDSSFGSSTTYSLFASPTFINRPRMDSFASPIFINRTIDDFSASLSNELGVHGSVWTASPSSFHRLGIGPIKIQEEDDLSEKLDGSSIDKRTKFYK